MQKIIKLNSLSLLIIIYTDKILILNKIIFSKIFKTIMINKKRIKIGKRDILK